VPAFAAACSIAVALAVGSSLWAAPAAGRPGAAARSSPIPRPGAEDRRLARLENEYLDSRLADRPDLATRLGDHRQDDRLEPVGEHALDAARERLGAFAQRLDSIPRPSLSASWALERDAFAARLAAERTDLEVVRRWERDPTAYLALAGDAIAALLERGPKSPCERTRALARRLARVPEVLRAARVNLRDPPALLVEDARPAYERLLRFYRSAVPQVGTECREERVQADLAQADSSAVRAAEDFLDYLQADLPPHAAGPAALGEEATRRWLADVALESASPDSLIARGRRELAQIEARLDTVAAIVAPGGSLGIALDSLRVGAPPADSLPRHFERALEGLRAFISTHAFVSLPESERLRVREAPPYRRGGPLVALDPPGPRDAASTEAWLYVTPPESLWSAERGRTDLAALDRWSAQVLLMREVFPGRYLQAIAWRRAPTRLRQAFAPATTTEGWARYAGQVMLERGYGAGDPRLERAWLLETRRDVAGAVATLAFHTERMTLEEAAAFLERAGAMAPEEARHEARRIAAGFDGAAPALGRWQILELRAELSARLGARFDLRAFHDALLRQGAVPLPLAGAALLAAAAR
jgi:uncharacterized protein (DUF885 family)